MARRTALGLLCLVSPLVAVLGQANAQYYAAPAPGAQPEAAAPAAPAAPAIPNDIHLVLMIRNAVLALNQANWTGNYSVLRDMGTPSFQMTNSSARLAEIFTGIRARKIDLLPILAFNPKLISPPAVQDGQVLRLTGFFPTSPEQVTFDLAFQRDGERWLLAGIAVNTAPAEGPQALAPQAQSSRSADADSRTAPKPGEARPIRIDLSQPVQPPAKANTPKKPAAKKAKPHSEKTAAVQAPAAPSAEKTAPQPAPSAAAEEKPPTPSAPTQSGWNPFGR
ncbi:MAG: hypothetical protein WBX25_27725 [Rhodomicrobium sp.]